MKQCADGLSGDAEVVLCMLLAKFTFAPSDKNVNWNLAGVRYPTVGKSPKPSLPINVTLCKPASPVLA